LCLLAALFAIEAKLAWYAPASAPITQISSAKLQPTDPPRLIANEIAASRLVPHLFEAAEILIFALILGNTRLASQPVKSLGVKFLSSSLSPQLSFRPPPVL
jgi:hypothetical protein